MLLVSVSDILSQVITHSTDLVSVFLLDKKHPILRNLRFIIWGFLFGIIGHYYITLVNELIPGKTITCIIEKLLIDQVFASR